MITLNCPKCAKEFKIKDEHAGRKFACTECGKECHVPTLQELQQSSAIAAAVPAPTKSVPTPLPPKRPVKASAKRMEEPAEELPAPTDPAVDPEPLPEPSDQETSPASVPAPSPVAHKSDVSPIWRKLERNAGSPRFWIGLGAGVLALNLASIGVTLWVTGFFAKGKHATSDVKLTAKQLSLASEAIKALGRIEAAVEIGVNHQQYTKLIVEANADVNEARRALPTSEILSNITDSIVAYRDAATVWSHKIQYSSLGLKNDYGHDEIISRYELRLDKDGVANPDVSMQIIWKAGSGHLANARKQIGD